MLEINWTPDSRELRKFGVAIWIGFALIGGAFRFSGHGTTALWMWGSAAAVGALALAWPRAALPFYRVWMGIGFVMGSVVSRLAMVLIFFGVLAPIGLLFKLKGRDALGLKKQGESYWTEHPRIEDPSYYDHLF
jgi:Saxitoxin biosynthesis operon protein SxtJ